MDGSQSAADGSAAESSDLEPQGGDGAELPALLEQFARLGVLLDIHGVADRSWEHSLRRLAYLHALGEYRLVAVTGGQGAGKTRFLRNLYPSTEGWLRPGPEVGERIPVIVVEIDGLGGPHGYALCTVDGRPGLETVEHDSEEWSKLLDGHEPGVILVRLEVPPGFWGLDRTGFVLLPGFERRPDDPLQDLMRVVLTSTPAAVVVTDEQRMGDGMQGTVVGDVASSADASVNAIVVLSRCEGRSVESIDGLRTKAAERFHVPAERVVAIGADTRSPAGWAETVHKVALDILPAAGDTRRQRAKALGSVVRTDIDRAVKAAIGVLARGGVAIGEQALAEQIMTEFHNERARLLHDLDQDIDRRFGAHFTQASRRLDGLLQERGRSHELGQRGWDLITINPDGADARTLEVVRDAWMFGDVGALHGQSLAAVAAQRRAALNPPSSLEALRVLVQDGAISPNLTDLVETVRLLPVMAVETRAFLAGFAEPDGYINVPDEATMAAGLGRLPDDLRALLAGLAMLAGLDLMVDVGANGPAVLGGVLHALLAGTGAGAAGGTGAGAAGAGAALAPALAAAVVVGLVLGGIYVGNRAAREFGRRARRLLRDQRAEAAARLQADVENLLRLTGEILEARLRTALRTDDVTINRVALTQAVKDMQRACSRMIEALGAGAVV